MTRSCVATWVVAALSCLQLRASSHAVTVSDIRVVNDGAGPLDEGAVRARISQQVGDEFNANAASRDVKTLRDTGRYSYVGVEVAQAEDGGVIVIYNVVSRPRVRKLHISGARDFTNKKIKKIMELAIGDRVDEGSLAVATQKVVDEYRKKYYPDVRVSSNIEEDAVSGTADVYVTVQEGNRAKVKKIRFPGAEHVPARQLRKVMVQKQLSLLSWITGTGVYSPADLTSDRIAVRRVFLDQGYLDAEVGEPDIQQQRRNKLTIDLPITEGRRYKVGAITSEGMTLFDPNAVMQGVTLRTGDVASMADVESATEGRERLLRVSRIRGHRRRGQSGCRAGNGDPQPAVAGR